MHGGNAFIMVDMGMDRPIDEVVVYNRLDCCNHGGHNTDSCVSMDRIIGCALLFVNETNVVLGRHAFKSVNSNSGENLEIATDSWQCLDTKAYQIGKSTNMILRSVPQQSIQ